MDSGRGHSRIPISNPVYILNIVLASVTLAVARMEPLDVMSHARCTTALKRFGWQAPEVESQQQEITKINPRGLLYSRMIYIYIHTYILAYILAYTYIYTYVYIERKRY